MSGVCLPFYEVCPQSALYSLGLPLFFSHLAGSALWSEPHWASRRQHSSNRRRSGAKVLATEMCAGLLASVRSGLPCSHKLAVTVSKGRNPHRTLDLTSKWLQWFHSGTNQIWKHVPQRTQLRSCVAAVVTRAKGAWKKAIRDCGPGDRAAGNARDGLEEGCGY